MADRRKLQGEIERCLKKITEGVEIFEDIWQKIQAAPNVAMKEKHEADLKKEIKKLQRLRDQLKTWLAASDIKDKKTLLDYKKLIEVQMERFKVIERETKTKAYSKEGLGLATKVDPKEKEKDDMIAWLSTSIEELNVQIDQFESEIESASSKKKKLDKEKQDAVENNKQHVEKHRYHIDQLETIMRLVTNDAIDVQQIVKIKDDVEYYISSNREPEFEHNDYLYDDLNLEEISATLGAKLQSSGGSGGHDDAESGISEETSETMSVQNSLSPSPSPSLTTTTSHHSKEEEGGTRTRLRSSASESKSGGQNGPAGSGHGRTGKQHSGGKAAVSSSSSSTEQHQLHKPSSSSAAAVIPSSPAAAASATHPLLSLDVGSSGQAVSAAASGTPQSQNYAQAAGASHHTPLQHSISAIPGSSDKKGSSRAQGGDASDASPGGNWGTRPLSMPPPVSSAWGDPSSANTPAKTTNPAAAANPLLSLAAAARGQLQQQQSSTNGQPAAVQGAGPAEDINGAKMNGPITAVTTPGNSTATTQASATTLTLASSTSSSALGSLKTMTQQVLDSVSLSNPVPSAAGGSTDLTNSSTTTSFPRNPSIVPSVGTTSVAAAAASLAGYQSLIGSKPGVSGGSLGTVRFHPLLGVTPLGPQPLDRVNLVQMAMLESAANHLPMPDDSERVRLYFPRTPTLVPHYYTHLPPQISDSLDFFNRLSIETLFFIFYYMEGTKAQYLAAKALKHKSWRFHTKLLMWFQRFEEPKLITEEYEQGSYLYFDYEGWAQRQHDSFTFEYRYLEDHELL